MDKVAEWRRVRMPWPEIARQLRLSVDVVKTRYGAVDLPAPVEPRAAEAWCRPRVASRARPEVKAPGSKPRRAKSVAAPLDLTDALKAVALEAAVTALNLSPEAVRKGQFGHRKACIAAAYAFARFRGCPKAQASRAFDAFAQHLCPSGLTCWSIPDAAIAAIVNALYAAPVEP